MTTTSTVVGCKPRPEIIQAEIKLKKKKYEKEKTREQQWAFSATKHIARIKGVEEVSLFAPKGRDETAYRQEKSLKTFRVHRGICLASAASRFTASELQSCATFMTFQFYFQPLELTNVSRYFCKPSSF